MTSRLRARKNHRSLHTASPDAVDVPCRALRLARVIDACGGNCEELSDVPRHAALSSTKSWSRRRGLRDARRAGFETVSRGVPLITGEPRPPTPRTGRRHKKEHGMTAEVSCRSRPAHGSLHGPELDVTVRSRQRKMRSASIHPHRTPVRKRAARRKTRPRGRHADLRDTRRRLDDAAAGALQRVHPMFAPLRARRHRRGSSPRPRDRARTAWVPHNREGHSRRGSCTREKHASARTRFLLPPGATCSLRRAGTWPP